MFDWSDLRYFLEVHRAGKLAPAGRKLGVDQTTVSRRLQNLERAIGTNLFNQTVRGYSLTEAGARLLPHAEAMESLGMTIQEEVAGESQAASGNVRIGVTEGLGTLFLARHLMPLRQAFPGIEIELMSLPRFVDMFNREADIAIGQERPVAERLVTTKLSDYALRLYASPEYLAQHPPIDTVASLSGHSFIGYIDDLLYSRELDYVSRVCTDARVVIKSTSIIAQLEAAEAGAGLAILPCFMVRPDSMLVCVLEKEIELGLSYWMTTRSELIRLSRVRAVWNYLKELLARKQDSMLGVRP